MTQTQAIVEALRQRDMTSLELTLATRVVNVTGRISDARAAGHRIVCYRDDRGHARYRLEERPVQLSFL